MDLASEIIMKRLQSRIDRLRPTQRAAYDAMKEGRNVLITGPGGTGKTSVIKLFVQMNPRNKKIAMTSTTGASAVLLGGTTLHSYLGIGLGKGTVASIVRRVRDNPRLHNRWNDVETLVIDEVSMMTPALFDKLEEAARTIRESQQPFGGIQIDRKSVV